MNPDVPLVVPEVNPDALDSASKIIANPNCSTIQKVVALKPLMDIAGLKRIVVSTYQSASGAGRDGMNELRDQTVDLLNFREPKTETFSRRLAFDTVPQIDVFQPDGFFREEHKMIFETRRSWANLSCQSVQPVFACPCSCPTRCPLTLNLVSQFLWRQPSKPSQTQTVLFLAKVRRSSRWLLSCRQR